MTGGLWLLLTGHSPYRQWEVYRKVRLIVVANAEDEASVPSSARRSRSCWRSVFPDSRAMMARGRDLNDLVRLVATKQLDAALMREEDAWIALRGTGRFADNGKVPFRTLAQFDASSSSAAMTCRTPSPTRSLKPCPSNGRKSAPQLRTAREVRSRLQRRESRCIPARRSTTRTTRNRVGSPTWRGRRSAMRRRRFVFAAAPAGAKNARGRDVSPHSESRKASSCLRCSSGNALYRLVTPAA